MEECQSQRPSRAPSEELEMWQIQTKQNQKNEAVFCKEPFLELPEIGLILGITLISCAKQARTTLCDHLHILLSPLWKGKNVKIKSSHQRRCTNPALRGPSSSLVCSSVRGWSCSPLQPHLFSLCQKPVGEPYWITAHSRNIPISSSVKWVTVILQGY